MSLRGQPHNDANFLERIQKRARAPFPLFFHTVDYLKGTRYGRNLTNSILQKDKFGNCKLVQFVFIQFVQARPLLDVTWSTWLIYAEHYDGHLGILWHMYNQCQRRGWLRIVCCGSFHFAACALVESTAAMVFSVNIGKVCLPSYRITHARCTEKF